MEGDKDKRRPSVSGFSLSFPFLLLFLFLLPLYVIKLIKGELRELIYTRPKYDTQVSDSPFEQKLSSGQVILEYCVLLS